MPFTVPRSEIGIHDARACPWRDDNDGGIHEKPFCAPMLTARIGRRTTSHGRSAEKEHRVLRFGYDEVRLAHPLPSGQLFGNGDPISLHLADERRTVGPLAVTPTACAVDVGTPAAATAFRLAPLHATNKQALLRLGHDLARQWQPARHPRPVWETIVDSRRIQRIIGALSATKAAGLINAGGRRAKVTLAGLTRNGSPGIRWHLDDQRFTIGKGPVRLTTTDYHTIYEIRFPGAVQRASEIKTSLPQSMRRLKDRRNRRVEAPAEFTISIGGAGDAHRIVDLSYTGASFRAAFVDLRMCPGVSFPAVIRRACRILLWRGEAKVRSVHLPEETDAADKDFEATYHLQLMHPSSSEKRRWQTTVAKLLPTNTRTGAV